VKAMRSTAGFIHERRPTPRPPARRKNSSSSGATVRTPQPREDLEQKGGAQAIPRGVLGRLQHDRCFFVFGLQEDQGSDPSCRRAIGRGKFQGGMTTADSAGDVLVELVSHGRRAVGARQANHLARVRIAEIDSTANVAGGLAPGLPQCKNLQGGHARIAHAA